MQTDYIHHSLLWVLEFWTWYKELKGDDVASAYMLCPLWTSFVSIYEGLSRIDLRQVREA